MVKRLEDIKAEDYNMDEIMTPDKDGKINSMPEIGEDEIQMVNQLMGLLTKTEQEYLNDENEPTDKILAKWDMTREDYNKAKKALEEDYERGRKESEDEQNGDRKKR